MFPASKGALSLIPGTGPAPILMRAAEWVRVVPEWERLTAHIENNEDIKNKLGWVREMYAFSIAAALEVSYTCLECFRLVHGLLLLSSFSVCGYQYFNCIVAF